MKKTTRTLAALLSLVLAISCFTFGSYAVETTTTVLDNDSYDTFCLADVISSVSHKYILSEDGVKTYVLTVEIDNEKYGFDVLDTLNQLHTVYESNQQPNDQLKELAQTVHQINATEELTPCITPTAYVSDTFYYSMEDTYGRVFFDADVTVGATWSRTGDVDSFIDNIDVSLNGLWDDKTTYDIKRSGSTAVIKFYNPLIAGSSPFFQSTFSISNTGILTDAPDCLID
ncbi:MAG: hypothetical protein IJY27_05805 [Clostridia bacterium]|nr:hypothetical protein [Clostridia bacterium]